MLKLIQNTIGLKLYDRSRISVKPLSLGRKDFDGEPWTALVEIALVGKYH